MSMLKQEYNLKGNPTEGLIGATLGFFIGFAAVVALGTTAKQFEGWLGLTGVLAGLLVAMPNLSGSLLRIPFSAWTDSVGGRKPFLVLLLLSLVGMAGLVLVASFMFDPDVTEFSAWKYILVITLGFLAGCGIATFSVGISQTSYWFKQDEQGKALGTYAGLGNTAPGIFSLIMAYSLASFGLAGSYMLWLVLLFIGTLVYYFIGMDAYYFQLRNKGVPEEKAKEIARELGQELFPKHNLVDSLKHSAEVWKTWALVGLYFTSFGGFIALASWFPKYWTDFHGTGTITIGIAIKVALVLNFVFVIVGSLTRVASGSIADKISGETTTTIGILTILLGGLVLTFAETFNPAIVGMLIISTGMGIVNAGVFKLVPKAVPDAVGGTAGWVGGLGAFGGFVIPPIMGAFVDGMGDIGYARGFSTFILLAIICLFIMWVLHNGKEE